MRSGMWKKGGRPLRGVETMMSGPIQVCMQLLIESTQNVQEESLFHRDVCSPEILCFTVVGYVATRYRKDNPELKQDNIQCYYPLIDALEETYTAYPNATFLFVVRETESWLDSMQSYHEGFIMDVWKRCRTQGFPGLDGTVEDFRDFYEWHKEMIRKFAMDHPSLTYIEVELEAEETGDILQEQVGINASCWGHYNQQKTEKASKTTSSNEMDEMDSEETSLI